MLPKVWSKSMVQKAREKLIYAALGAAALCSVVLLGAIIIAVCSSGLPAISVEFLTSVSSFRKGIIGIAGNTVNTIFIVILTLVIATPLGVGAAVYLNEYARNSHVVAVIECALQVLAGIPSIIFGLFGMLCFGQTLGLGYSLLCGALTLCLMILPLIVCNTHEALKSVPCGYRQGALSLGAGVWHTTRTVVLPSATPAIITGIVLALGRIVAESSALLFTAGSAGMLPHEFSDYLFKIFDSGGTLTVQLYLSATSQGDFKTAFGIALLLLVLTFIINTLTRFIISRFAIQKKGCS